MLPNRTLALVFALLCLMGLGLPSSVAVDPPKDTPAAAFTRTKKLQGKITVEFKDEMLREVFKEISSQLEDKKLGAISVRFGTGISANTKISYTGKEVTVERALDGILTQLDLGYVVVSKEKDRYDGWIEIVKGSERGYPTGVTTPAKGTAGQKQLDPKKTEPKKEEMKKEADKKDDAKTEEKDPPKDAKVTQEDEKQASSKLELAKKLQSDGKIDRAKVQLKFIVKHYNGTKAANEAKELLEKLDQ